MKTEENTHRVTVKSPSFVSHDHNLSGYKVKGYSHTPQAPAGSTLTHSHTQYDIMSPRVVKSVYCPPTPKILPDDCPSPSFRPVHKSRSCHSICQPDTRPINTPFRTSIYSETKKSQPRISRMLSVSTIPIDRSSEGEAPLEEEWAAHFHNRVKVVGSSSGQRRTSLLSDSSRFVAVQNSSGSTSSPPNVSHTISPLPILKRHDSGMIQHEANQQYTRESKSPRVLFHESTFESENHIQGLSDGTKTPSDITLPGPRISDTAPNTRKFIPPVRTPVMVHRVSISESKDGSSHKSILADGFVNQCAEEETEDQSIDLSDYYAITNPLFPQPQLFLKGIESPIIRHNGARAPIQLFGRTHLRTQDATYRSPYPMMGEFLTRIESGEDRKNAFRPTQSFGFQSRDTTPFYFQMQDSTPTYSSRLISSNGPFESSTPFFNEHSPRNISAIGVRTPSIPFNGTQAGNASPRSGGTPSHNGNTTAHFSSVHAPRESNLIPNIPVSPHIESREGFINSPILPHSSPLELRECFTISPYPATIPIESITNRQENNSPSSGRFERIDLSENNGQKRSTSARSHVGDMTYGTESVVEEKKDDRWIDEEFLPTIASIGPTSQEDPNSRLRLTLEKKNRVKFIRIPDLLREKHGNDINICLFRETETSSHNASPTTSNKVSKNTYSHRSSYSTGPWGRNQPGSAQRTYKRSNSLSVISNKLKSATSGSSTNMVQGEVGDCWLLAVLGGLAQYPKKLQNLFITKKFNPEGKYGIRLYDIASNRWVEVWIDDTIPCTWEQDWSACEPYIKQDGQKVYRAPQNYIAPSSWVPLLARLNGDNKDIPEMWPLLLEKAIAKFLGKSYSTLAGGMEPCAYLLFTGYPIVYVYNRPAIDVAGEIPAEGVWERGQSQFNPIPSDEKKAACGYRKLDGHPQRNNETLFKQLLSYYKRHFLMCASSTTYKSPTTTTGFFRKDGIVNGHAYTILSVQNVEEKIGDEKRQYRMVLLRNPHGKGKSFHDHSGEWNGPWSKYSNLWVQHPQVARSLNYDPVISMREGLFWMELNDFCKIYDTIHILAQSMAEPNGSVGDIQRRSNQIPFGVADQVLLKKISEINYKRMTVHIDPFLNIPKWLSCQGVEKIVQWYAEKGTLQSLLEMNSSLIPIAEKLGLLH